MQTNTLYWDKRETIITLPVKKKILLSPGIDLLAVFQIRQRQ